MPRAPTTAPERLLTEVTRRLDDSFRGSLRLAGASFAEIQGEYRPHAPPLPRARLVAHSVVSAEPAKTLGQIDPALTAILDAPLDRAWP